MNKTYNFQLKERSKSNNHFKICWTAYVLKSFKKGLFYKLPYQDTNSFIRN